MRCLLAGGHERRTHLEGSALGKCTGDGRRLRIGQRGQPAHGDERRRARQFHWWLHLGRSGVRRLGADGCEFLDAAGAVSRNAVLLWPVLRFGVRFSWPVLRARHLRAARGRRHLHPRQRSWPRFSWVPARLGKLHLRHDHRAVPRTPDGLWPLLLHRSCHRLRWTTATSRESVALGAPQPPARLVQDLIAILPVSSRSLARA